MTSLRCMTNTEKWDRPRSWLKELRHRTAKPSTRVRLRPELISQPISLPNITVQYSTVLWLYASRLSQLDTMPLQPEGTLCNSPEFKEECVFSQLHWWGVRLMDGLWVLLSVYHTPSSIVWCYRQKTLGKCKYCTHWHRMAIGFICGAPT